MKFSILLSFLILFTHPLLANVSSTKITFGRFNSRGILNLTNESRNAPLIILIPGSGANGPEEMIPSSLTTDKKDTAIFNDIAAAFNKAGVNTFQIGKPGVNFFTAWSAEKFFYDYNMYVNSTWDNLLQNVEDAIQYANKIPKGPRKIFILGHSEGTQVAVDYAAKSKNVSGLILLGFFGESLKTTLQWQLYRRSIEHFVATDVDRNHDGQVTREEAKTWPDFVWSWKENQNQISYQEIESELRADPQLKNI